MKAQNLTFKYKEYFKQQHNFKLFLGFLDKNTLKANKIQMTKLVGIRFSSNHTFCTLKHNTQLEIQC